MMSIGVARHQVARRLFCTFEGSAVANVVEGFAGVNGDAPTEIKWKHGCLRVDRGRRGEALGCPSARVVSGQFPRDDCAFRPGLLPGGQYGDGQQTRSEAVMREAETCQRCLADLAGIALDVRYLH